MIITLNEPFADLRGSIDKHHYIRRFPSGKFILQQNPNRKSHKKTPAEAANQQRFAMRYAQRIHRDHSVGCT